MEDLNKSISHLASLNTVFARKNFCVKNLIERWYVTFSFAKYSFCAQKLLRDILIVMIYAD